MHEASNVPAALHKQPSDVGALDLAARRPRRSRVDPDVPGLGLLTIEQAADALNVPMTWLRDKVTERRVPHTRLGRHVRFTPAHLREIVAAGEQSAVPPRPATGSQRGRRRSTA